LVASRLANLASQALGGRDLRPVLAIDTDITPHQLTLGLHRSLDGLAPFGEGNPQPHLVVRDVVVTQPRIVGNEHLKFVVEGGAGAGSLDAIAFGQADRIHALRGGSRVDLAFRLGRDEWGGTPRVQLEVVDMAAPGEGLTSSSAGQ